jgi:glycosyltransferase involved in cell wall biosynthesis
MNITLVVWDSLIGGAERLSVSLAGEFNRQGAQAGIVFAGRGDQLRPQLEANGVPAVQLGFSRGAMVIRHPRLLARALSDLRSDVAIVGGFSYLGAAARAGGFRGGLIGVEHGHLAHVGVRGAQHRLRDRVKMAKHYIARAAAVPTHDAEVAVSEFMERLARKTLLHGRRLVRIAHGIDIPWPAPLAPQSHAGAITIGYAGRLISGKGLEVLLRACALLREDHGAEVRVAIAGDGPLRRPLESLAQTLGIARLVEFIGWTEDVTQFWADCQIAVGPNDTLRESFCLSIAEAMSCSRAVIVTDVGALPELVAQNETGLIVPAGDPSALAEGIVTYLTQPGLLAEHGIAARARAESRYSLRRCAADYISLCTELLPARGSAS